METSNSDEDREPNLSEILFSQLQIPEILANMFTTEIILDEVLVALFHAGMLTSDQLLAVLDRAELDVTKFCDQIAAKHQDEHTKEILDRMTNRARKTSTRIKDRLSLKAPEFG